MKMLIFFSLVVVVMSSASIHAQSRLPSNYVRIINDWIGEENARTKPADAEYASDEGDVTILTGDLDGDGDDDCVANYGVTYGGNALTDYLAVFINTNGKLSEGYTEAVGITGAEVIDSMSIHNGVIICTTYVWKSDDGYCCPSGKGKVSYVFRQGKIEKL